MKKKHLWLMSCGAAMVTLIVSCTMNGPLQNEQTISPEGGPGTFGMSWLKGMSKQAASTAVAHGTIVKFDLGSIKGSSAFYFLLYNIGKSKITNVTLAMSDSGMFSVYPAKIDTLIPGSDVGMLPIVKIVAYHGTAIDGAGSRPLMPKGPHSTELVISGTTKTCRGTDTNVILSAGMDLTALVMDAELLFNDSLVDLGMPIGGIGGGLTLDSFDIPNMRGYPHPGNNEIDTNFHIKIANTGNVPLSIKVFYYPSGGFVISDTLKCRVTAGETVAIPSHRNFSFFFCLDGNNTVSSPLLRQETNGKCYFMVY
jgi:hypothetical protein